MRTKHLKPKRVYNCKVNTTDDGKSYYDRKTLRTIRKLQLSVDLIITKLSFSRVVMEILQQFSRYKTTALALEALHESAELYMTQLLSNVNLYYKRYDSLRRKKRQSHESGNIVVTTFPKDDVNLMGDLHGPLDPSNL